MIIHIKLKFKLSKRIRYFVIKFDYFLLLKIINLSNKFNLNKKSDLNLKNSIQIKKI